MSETDKVINDAINEHKIQKTTRKDIEKPRLYTGNTLRDVILGGEKGILGVKVGVIWNMIGNASGGKTFESTELIATNKRIYKDRFKYNFDLTSEAGNEIDCEKLYGFDIITEKSLRSETVEELQINIKKFLATIKENELGCYIVDSLDGLVSKEIKDRIKKRELADRKGKEFDEGSYFMEKQKFLKFEFFPQVKTLIEKSNCLLIIISQQTEKVGIVFGSKRNRAGGTALRYFSHIESWQRQVDEITVTKRGETRVVGIRNITKFTRTRNERPFREHFNTIYFDYGVDDLSSNLDFLFRLLTDGGKEKSNFNVEFKDQKFTSRKELITYIEQNDLEEEIKQMTIDKWEEVEDSIKMERKRKY